MPEIPHHGTFETCRRTLKMCTRRSGSGEVTASPSEWFDRPAADIGPSPRAARHALMGRAVGHSGGRLLTGERVVDDISFFD